MLSAAHVAAQTWDDVERLMYAEQPINFLLEGETKAAFTWDKLPPAATVARAAIWPLLSCSAIARSSLPPTHRS